MPSADDIRWFKTRFHTEISHAVQDTPLTVDALTALACQETGYIWQTLRREGLPLEEILELCVGDTLDADSGRSAFPATKADLLRHPRGEAMFAIARDALVRMAQHVNGYRSAAANPDKFCHGFGIFQYDLQFFKTDPDYFLQKRYAVFSASLAKCLKELKRGLKKLGWQDRRELTDYETACVAIIYNRGRFTPSAGLRQGHLSDGVYYGEAYFDYLRRSKAIPHTPGDVQTVTPTPGAAVVAQPTALSATGALYRVDVRTEGLRLRREPAIDPDHPTANVITVLPAGHVVRAVADVETAGFLEVETSVAGAHYRGYASARYLATVDEAEAITVETPSLGPVSGGLVPVHMPHRPETRTRRSERANARTLDEPGQPARTGSTAGELRSELAAIIDWLAVDNPQHLRYQPREGLTFCNIYAHDYCHLAGVYLPRVWWTPGAIERIAQGRTVEPLYDNTIDEQRANDLYRWLRDFGLRFGWRQTGTLSKLQLEVNQGAIGLIVARRRNDGRSGHIVMVVPETDTHTARREGAEVIAPLQSQAGAANFRYGTGKRNWWQGDQFAESAFWIHA